MALSDFLNSQDITSANAQIVLICETVVPVGVLLQQASVDTWAASDAIQVAETRMGVDGYMAAGVTPNIVPVTITLEANSPSKRVLDMIAQAMIANKQPYRCTLMITLPSTGEGFAFYRGVLQTANHLPALQKVLAPTQWVFHFERVNKI
jgi:hypothetical protein